MAERESHRRLMAVAQKWRDLAEARRDHYARLYDTGRWKLYYSEDEFLARMREVVTLAQYWADIAPRPADPFDVGDILEPLSEIDLEAA
jgi:uncharacterized repeat protein (TIGR03809 family)